MGKWGVLVCALATVAIVLTCRATSGRRRAARAGAIRLKTIRQRSEEAGGVASEAIEAGRSASGLDNRQTTEQWWGEGSVSGTQRRRPASGSHTDSLQPEQQLQQSTPSLSQVTPSAGSS